MNQPAEGTAATAPGLCHPAAAIVVGPLASAADEPPQGSKEAFMVRMRVIVVGVLLGFVVVSVAAVVNDFVGEYRKSQVGAGSNATPMMQSLAVSGEVSYEPVGSPEAKAKVTVLLDKQNSCHAPTAQALRAIAETVPNRLHVTYLDVNSPEGQKVAQAAGVTCQCGLLFNGVAEIPAQRNGQAVKLVFHGPLDHGGPDDLQIGMAAFLAENYGDDLTPEEMTKVQTEINRLWTPAGKAATGAAGQAVEEAGHAGHDHAAEAPSTEATPAPREQPTAGGEQGPPAPG
jgi:hypothetical protein